MVSGRTIRGSGSQSQSSQIEEEDDDPIIRDPSHPYLSPSDPWFDSNDVKKVVTRAIKAKFETFTSSWSAATPEQRGDWWNFFKNNFRYHKHLEEEVKAKFTERCGVRLRDMVYRAGDGSSANWMGKAAKKELLVYRNSEKFKKRSASAKINRASHGEGGKAPGTHAMGRINTVQLMDKLAETQYEGKAPPAHELVKKSKTKKLGGFVSSKAATFLDKFKSKKSAIQETQPDTPVDENSLYYEVVGGHDRKGRVYGVGEAILLYYEKHRRSYAGGSTYALGLVTKLTQENERLNDRVADLELWRERMSQSQRFDPTTESCNPNVSTYFRNDFDDDGDDGDGSADGASYVPVL